MIFKNDLNFSPLQSIEKILKNDIPVNIVLLLYFLFADSTRQ